MMHEEAREQIEKSANEAVKVIALAAEEAAKVIAKAAEEAKRVTDRRESPDQGGQEAYFKRMADFALLEKMSEEMHEVKKNLAVHEESHKTLDGKIDNLAIGLENLTKDVSGNGKPGLKQKVDKLYMYLYIGLGISMAVGAVYSIATLVVIPLMSR